MAYLVSKVDGDIRTVYFTEATILDQAMIQEVQRELTHLLEKTEEPYVLLDFRRVKFMASFALGVLVRAKKQCDGFKVTLKLSNICPDIRQVFKITHLDKILDIYDDAEQAYASFRKRGTFFRKKI